VAEFVGKELQGDVATQLEVFRFMDHSHAPVVDLAEFAVMENRLILRSRPALSRTGSARS
jgi:hypothetical protein